jgi:hypothetical protein
MPVTTPVDPTAIGQVIDVVADLDRLGVRLDGVS